MPTFKMLKALKDTKTSVGRKCRTLVKDVKDTVRRLGPPFGRARMEPNTEASSLADGDPSIDGDPAFDAMKGNSIWGVKGVPGTRSLKTCDDGGAALLLQTIDEAIPSEPPPDSTTVFAGARFEQDAIHRPSAINDLDIVGDPKTNGQRELKKMDEALRKSSRTPFKGDPHKFYIPNDRLQSIMSRDAIKQILPCIARGVALERADKLVQDICGHGGRDQKPTKSFRKVLAVLILIGKADRILDFMDAGVMDTKLPLCKLGDSRPFQLCLTGCSDAIPLFEEWDYRDIENFENKQWETLAPFFSTEVKGDDRVPSYQLTQHPLPFEIIQDSECTGSVNRNLSSHDATGDTNLSALGHYMNGAHGKVWKVKIPRAHHNLPSYRGNEVNPSLAIKMLLVADRDAFKNEVGILTRLNRDSDPHLVKLLLTMEIQGGPGKDIDFYLMFPLADSNLRQFWNHKFPHPKGMSPVTYGRWVARQLHGLTRALWKLHDLHEREVHSLENKGDGDGAETSSTDPFYGIHGDIKPENLLWYKEWVGPSPLAEDSMGSDPLGVIQLADFGISGLHHTLTRSEVDLRRATKTYAAPEVEWGVYGGSRSFDIWSLGCVFLEFICWLVLGGSGPANPVDEFQKARYLDRKNRSLEGTLQDTFYHLIKSEDETKFEVNPAVKKLINDLQKAPACSLFVDDILHIVFNDMLVVESRKTSMGQRQQQSKRTSGIKAPPDLKRRISCPRLDHKLAEIIKKGHEDSYFTKRGPKPPRPITREAPQTVTIHESAQELVQFKRLSVARTFSIDDRKIKGDGARHE